MLRFPAKPNEPFWGMLIFESRKRRKREREKESENPSGAFTVEPELTTTDSSSLVAKIHIQRYDW
jgi:hypothetical protein